MRRLLLAAGVLVTLAGCGMAAPLADDSAIRPVETSETTTYVETSETTTYVRPTPTTVQSGDTRAGALAWAERHGDEVITQTEVLSRLMGKAFDSSSVSAVKAGCGQIANAVAVYFGSAAVLDKGVPSAYESMLTNTYLGATLCADGNWEAASDAFEAVGPQSAIVIELVTS